MAGPQFYNPFAAPVYPTADDNAMQPETFVPQGAREWTQQAAPKDYNIISQIAGSLGKTLMYPGLVAQSQVPISTQDMIEPAFNLASMLTLGGMPMAEKGAAGIFGGRLAQTADQTALAKAEQLHAAGAPREQIWNDTGWFKGADDKWRFEIPDNKSAISPSVASEFERRNVGDQVPVQNADRFLNHPELFSAYPDLWRVNTRLTKGGGYPYQPSANYSVRESGAEGIGVNADTLGQARSMNMHELQHAVQQREGFAQGADATKMGKDAYYATPGEIEAYNVQRRLFMTPEERRASPPWATE